MNIQIRKFYEPDDSGGGRIDWYKEYCRVCKEMDEKEKLLLTYESQIEDAGRIINEKDKEIERLNPLLPNLDKSTKNLSKIKDKDEWLKEIRGAADSTECVDQSEIWHPNHYLKADNTADEKDKEIDIPMIIAGGNTVEEKLLWATKEIERLKGVDTPKAEG